MALNIQTFIRLFVFSRLSADGSRSEPETFTEVAHCISFILGAILNRKISNEYEIFENGKKIYNCMETSDDKAWSDDLLALENKFKILNHDVTFCVKNLSPLVYNGIEKPFTALSTLIETHRNMLIRTTDDEKTMAIVKFHDENIHFFDPTENKTLKFKSFGSFYQEFIEGKSFLKFIPIESSSFVINAQEILGNFLCSIRLSDSNISQMFKFLDAQEINFTLLENFKNGKSFLLLFSKQTTMSHYL